MAFLVKFRLPCGCGCGKLTRRREKIDLRHVPYRKRHHKRPKPAQYHVSDSGCWEWAMYTDSAGYGWKAVLRSDGTWGRIGAHRYMYEKVVGPIPHGLTIDHLCRNKACVNPAHLEPVTQAENTRRRPGGWKCRRRSWKRTREGP